jgi:hypothetical protein
VRKKSDQTKKPAPPAAAKGSNTARVKAAIYDGIPTDAHQSPYILVLTDQPVRTRSLVLSDGQPLILFQITLHHNQSN